MTIKELQRKRLRRYLECEAKILINQSYTIGSRTYTRADLEEVRKVITSLLESGVTLEEEASRCKQKRVVFVE